MSWTKTLKPTKLILASCGFLVAITAYSYEIKHTYMASPFQRQHRRFADFFIMSFKESINRYISGLIYELWFADLSEMWLLNWKRQQENLVEYDCAQNRIILPKDKLPTGIHMKN